MCYCVLVANGIASGACLSGRIESLAVVFYRLEIVHLVYGSIALELSLSTALKRLHLTVLQLYLRRLLETFLFL